VPYMTVTLTVQCHNLVNFSGTKIKGYFIFNFILKYLNFSMLWVNHLWLVTLHLSLIPHRREYLRRRCVDARFFLNRS
jgi:hypothetical protein